MRLEKRLTESLEKKYQLNEAAGKRYIYQAALKDKSGKGVAVLKGRIRALTDEDAKNKVHDILTIDQGYKPSDIIDMRVKLNESKKSLNEDILLKVLPIKALYTQVFSEDSSPLIAISKICFANLGCTSIILTKVA